MQRKEAKAEISALKAIENIPDRQLLLFKSCMVGQEYPGVESSTRYVFERLGIDYCVNDEQSCCTGIGHYTDIFEGLTTTAIAARNFAVARKSGYPNITCLCSTCYAINKEACEVLNTNTEIREKINSIFREHGLEHLVYEKDDMDAKTNFYHAVEILLSKADQIENKKKFDFSGIKAAAHHACHYYKAKYQDVLGNPENPQLIDTIAAACGAEPVRWYEDRTLTCGMGFSQLHLNKKTSLQVTKAKLDSLQKAGVELMIHMCPNCHIQYDRYQPVIEKEFKVKYNLVHMNIAQFVALSMGADPYKICGFQTHSVPLEGFLEKNEVI